MNAHSQSEQAAEIVRGLAGMPGGREVNIIARKYPRGPVGAASSYEQEERSFPLDRLPPQLPISGNMDEIVITLRGELDESQSTVSLLAELNDVVGGLQIGACWDSRVFLHTAARSGHAYQVTVFTDVFGIVPSA